MIEIKSDSSVFIDNLKVGEINGFILKVTDSSEPSSDLFLKNLKKGLIEEIKLRVKNFYSIEDHSLEISENGKFSWDGSPIGWLIPSDDPFKPNIQVLQSDLLNQDQIYLISQRLKKYLENIIEKNLSPLINIKEDDYSSSCRGIIFQIKEGFGTTSIKKIFKLYKEITDEEKREFSKVGLRFGVEYLYMPELLKPGAVKLRALLWGVTNNAYYRDALPDDGRVAYTPKEVAPSEWYNQIGYSKLGNRVMRVDMVERLLALIRIAARGGSFKISEEMLSIAGASKDELFKVLIDLGFEKLDKNNNEEVSFDTLFGKKQKKLTYKSKQKFTNKNNTNSTKKTKTKNIKKTNEIINKDSPFFVLSNLKIKNWIMDKDYNQRLDQWLWQVRIFKTRHLASKAIISGNIKVDTKIIKKTHFLITIGSKVEVFKTPNLKDIEVLKLSSRRISPKEINLYYLEIKSEVDTTLENNNYYSSSKSERIGKLNKKERRIINEFKEKNIFLRGDYVWNFQGNDK